MGNTDIFNKLAASYDSADRLVVNQVIVQQIKQQLAAQSSGPVLLDFGCGTGEVGLSFIDDFEHIIFADTSVNMLAVVEEKVAQRGLGHISTVQIIEGEDLSQKADCIILSQVLLHVADTIDLLDSLYRTLNQHGRLLIIDFDKNKLVTSELVHPGFEQAALIKMLQRIGFTINSAATFYQGERLFMGQDASLFCINATK